MPKWADLSSSDPDDSELVRLGAGRIRDGRAAAKETWDVEHHQTGEHRFPTSQPGSPVDGQIWLDLANRFIKLYDGGISANRIVPAVGFGYAQRTTTFNFVPSVFDTAISVTVTVPLGAIVVCIGVMTLLVDSLSNPVTDYVSTRIARDDAALTSVEFRHDFDLPGATTTVNRHRTVTAIEVDAAVAFSGGTHTYQLQGKESNAFISANCTSGSFLCLVL